MGSSCIDYLLLDIPKSDLQIATTTNISLSLNPAKCISVRTQVPLWHTCSHKSDEISQCVQTYDHPSNRSNTLLRASSSSPKQHSHGRLRRNNNDEPCPEKSISKLRQSPQTNRASRITNKTNIAAATNTPTRTRPRVRRREAAKHNGPGPAQHPMHTCPTQDTTLASSKHQ